MNVIDMGTASNLWENDKAPFISQGWQSLPLVHVYDGIVYTENGHHSTPHPNTYDLKTSSLQRLLLLRICKPCSVIYNEPDSLFICMYNPTSLFPLCINLDSPFNCI